MSKKPNAFEIAVDAYKFHLHQELGYSMGETALMLTGFAAGWVAHRDLIDNPSAHFCQPNIAETEEAL